MAPHDNTPRIKEQANIYSGYNYLASELSMNIKRETCAAICVRRNKKKKKNNNYNNEFFQERFFLQYTETSTRVITLIQSVHLIQ